MISGRLRHRLVVGAIVLSVVALGAGYSRYRARAAASHWVPPVLVDPPPGPRSPSTEVLGVRVGTSHLADVRAVGTAWGLACADRGVRVLMSEIREKKRAEIEQAKLRGTPDAVTGASILTHHTARDDNPQIRLSCEDTPSSRLKDRARVPSTGRALYVFDDERAPVRHASFERNHPTWGAALADFMSTRDAMAARFGKPRESQSGGGTGDAPLGKYMRRAAEFPFVDLAAAVTVANLGGRGYSVTESVEVPLPLRPDAPAR